MENKLNFEAIDTYVKAYSSKLLNKLYDNQETISGDDILKVPVQQVGLLILNTIYQSWAFESKKLKSPFFDYKSEAVQASMQKLMNVLSKNIVVGKAELAPLLSKAVEDTLLLLLSPYTYYKTLLEKEESNIESLEGLIKFITINKGLLGSIIEELHKSGYLIDDPNALLDKVFTSLEDIPQNNDKEIQKFGEIHPFNSTEFYIDLVEERIEKPTELEEGEDDDEPGSELEKTLNDSFVGSSYETVADTLKSSHKSGTLKSMLSINQKFMFINDLFNDSQDDFNKVMDFLESCETKDSAISFINNNYLKHNIWNANAPQVKEFLALLDKKFIA